MVENTINLIHLPAIITLLHFLASANSLAPPSQCCSQFDINNTCIACPAGTHLYRGNCLFDIASCKEYVMGFDCASCLNHYSLISGQCVHKRISQEMYNNLSFAIYLQSALKPDAMLQAALENIKNNTQIWYQYSNVSLLQNKTYLNPKALTKYSLSLKQKVMAGSILHYIHMANQTDVNATYIFYRFTYQPTLFSGFVDLLVTLQLVDGKINYIQLATVSIYELDKAFGWISLPNNDSDLAYVLQRLEAIFPAIAGKAFMKGFLFKNDEGYNFTCFYMDSSKSPTIYYYLADPSELQAHNDTISHDKINPLFPQIQGATASITQNVSTTTIQNTTPNASNETHHSALLPSTNATQPTKNQILNQTKNQTSANKKTIPINNSSQSGNSTIAARQISVNVSQLMTNPIYMMGYATALQEPNVSKTTTVTALFFINTSPKVYGLYLTDISKAPILYYKFCYSIDLSLDEVHVISFNKSTSSFALVNSTTHPSTNNSSKVTNTSVPLISLPNKNESNGSCFILPSTNVDITGNMQKDIFLPRINLLLHTMYDEIISNCTISKASYIWTMNDNLINNITYNIQYSNLDDIKYQYEVGIYNNEFKLLKAPSISIIKINKTDQNISVNEVNTKNVINISNVPVVENDSNTSPLKPEVTPKPIPTSNKTITNNTIQNSTYKPIDPQWLEIPAANYTTQPKYKSLIMITRSLRKVPANATINQMKKAHTNGSFQKYEIIFYMNYSQALDDGSNLKISTFQLSVDPNSFVTVLNQRFENKIVTPVPLTVPKIQPHLPEPSLKLSILSVANSPYFREIVQIFKKHSPKLSQFNSSSILFNLTGSKDGKLIRHYSELIKFSNQSSSICYRVKYSVVFTNLIESLPASVPTIVDPIVFLTKYEATSCSKQKVLKTANITFQNSSKYNSQVNATLLSIHGNQTINIQNYQQYQQFYRICYSDPQEMYQVVIDSKEAVVIAFLRFKKIAYIKGETGNSSSIVSEKLITGLENQMNKLFTTTNLSIISVEAANLAQDFWFVNAYGRKIKSSNWMQPQYKYFTIRCLFWSKSLYIRVVNTTIVPHSTPQRYIIYSLSQNTSTWSPPFLQTLTNSQLYQAALSSLHNNYINFMQSTNIVSVYTTHSISNTSQNNQTDIPMKITVVKKYTQSYFVSYLLSINYNCPRQSVEIGTIDSISAQDINILGCQIYLYDTVLPICTQCDSNFVLVDNSCIPLVNNCIAYMGDICVKCKGNSSPNQNQRCEVDFNQEAITKNSIESYLKQQV